VGVYEKVAALMAVTVDSPLNLLGDVNPGALLSASYAGAAAAGLNVPSCGQRGLAALSIKLRLRWASLAGGCGGGRRFAAVPPLVDGPAHAQSHGTNGDQYYDGDKPVLHGNVLFAPHYSHERSNAYA